MPVLQLYLQDEFCKHAGQAHSTLFSQVGLSHQAVFPLQLWKLSACVSFSMLSSNFHIQTCSLELSVWLVHVYIYSYTYLYIVSEAIKQTFTSMERL